MSNRPTKWRRAIVFLKNVSNPKNWRYTIQGYYRSFIAREYEKLYSEGSLDKALQAAADCPECLANEECAECFCSFKELALSDKICPRHERRKKGISS